MKFLRSYVLWAALIAVGLTACDDPFGISAEDYIEKARAELAADNLQAGVIELKNAVQKDPKNALARSLLGQLYLRLGNGAAAEKELSRSRQLGRFDMTERLALVQALLIQGKIEAALAEMPEDPAEAGEQGAWFLVLRGQARAAQEDWQAAVQDFEAALAGQSIPEAHLGLAQIALQQADLDRLDGRLNTGLASHPEEPRLKVLRGEWHLRKGDYVAAEGVFEEASKAGSVPQSRLARYGVARALVAQERFADADSVLAELVQEVPNAPEVMLLGALVNFRQGRFQEAQSQALQLLNLDRENLMATGIAGVSSFYLGAYEQANQLLTFYVARVPSDSDARQVLGATRIKLGKADEAYEALVLPEGQNGYSSNYHSLLGFAAALSGDLETGLKELEAAAEKDPGNATKQAQLGLLRVAMGDTLQGQSDLLGAVGRDPELGADPSIDRATRALILQHLNAQRFADALDLAQQKHREEPEVVAWPILAAAALIGQGETLAAMGDLQTALEISPGHPDASLNLAQLYRVRGEPDVGFEILRDSLDQYPDNPAVTAGVTALASELGRQDDARAWFEATMRAHPEAVSPRIELAKLDLAAGDPAAALAITSAALAANPDHPRLLAAVGEAQLQSGQAAAATTTFERLVDAAPSSAQARFLLGRAYATAGDLDRAISELQDALRFAPDFREAKIVLARLSIAQGDLEGARPLAEQLVRDHPEMPEVLEIDGHMAMADGAYSAALERFQAAQAELGLPRLAIKIANAQAQAGDPAAGAATMEAWMASHPDDQVVRLQLAGAYVGLERFEDARANFTRVLDAQPQNWVARNDLAWVLYQTGDLAQARAHAEGAHQESQGHPAVADTLAVILMAQGENERALGLARQAHTQMPAHPEIAFHLAQALAGADETGAAVTLLQETLAEHAQFGEREAAEKLLQKLGG